jgi:hypothetical protein
MSIKPPSFYKAKDADISANQETPVADPVSVSPLSTDQLLSIIAKMQEQMAKLTENQSVANQALADAILETTKPREVIKTKEQKAREANDELFRKNEKELELRKKTNIKASQSICDHIAGGSELSEQRDIAGRTSIAWHRNDVGGIAGVCTTCGRIFYPGQEDYALWRRKPSFNRLSAAGFRTVLDPSAAINEAFLKDS